MDIQTQIDDLIKRIDTAFSPRSVTNKDVAAVLDYLNDMQKSAASGLTETGELILALKRSIEELRENCEFDNEQFTQDLNRIEGMLDPEMLGKMKDFLDKLESGDSSQIARIFLFDGFGDKGDGRLAEYQGEEGTQRILFDNAHGVFFLRLYQDLSSYEDFSTWPDCTRYGEYVVYEGVRPVAGRWYISSSGVYYCPENTDLEQVMAGVTTANLADYCMEDGKGQQITDDALLEDSQLRATDKRKLVNVGLLRDVMAAFLKNTKEWLDNYLENAPVPDTLSAWQRNYLEEMERKEREGKLSVSFSMSPSGNEYDGVSRAYSLLTTVRFDGVAVDFEKEITPGSNLALRMSDGELKAAYTPPASSTGRETLSARVKVTYTDELGTISKESQTSIVLYAPIRFVCTTAEDAPDPDQILSGIKAVRSSAAGDYTIPFESGEYVWLCFPAFMSPSSFTSGGFEVPVEDALTVACRIGQTNVNYRCIRVSGKPKTSPIKISVG